jgi:hypothetical protein
VATAAASASEGDVSARVDGKAIILVLNDSSRDVHAGGRTNVESVGVVATQGIAEGVIHVDVVDSKVGNAVDAEGLDGGVENVQALDVGVLEGVGAEELGLGLSAVAALGIPPSLTLAVNIVARGTLDEEVVSGEGNQGTFPLLVAKGSLALEDDLRLLARGSKEELRYLT